MGDISVIELTHKAVNVTLQHLQINYSHINLYLENQRNIHVQSRSFFLQFCHSIFYGFQLKKIGTLFQYKV